MKHTDDNRQQEKNNRFSKNNKKKGLIFLLAAFFVLMVASGSTLAFIMTDSDPVINTFSPAKVASEVVEGSFNGSVKENVKIANVGNTEAYIRAAIVVTWKENDSANSVSAIKPEAGTDYTITLNIGEDGGWFQGSDGFYYHKKPVDYTGSNTSTSNLIIQCKPVEGKTPEGFVLSVEIIASAIQSMPVNVVEDQWHVNVDTENGNVLYK